MNYQVIQSWRRAFLLVIVIVEGNTNLDTYPNSDGYNKNRKSTPEKVTRTTSPGRMQGTDHCFIPWLTANEFSGNDFETVPLFETYPFLAMFAAYKTIFTLEQEYSNL